MNPSLLRPLAVLAVASSAAFVAACSSTATTAMSDLGPEAAGDYDGGTESVASDAGSGGSFGNVGTGGAQDFGAFRKALDRGQIPTPDTLDSTGFFAEHYTSLPAPTCGQTFCLHGMLSISHDLARGGDWTLLQMAMNSPIDPATVTRPPLDLAVVLDHSGSMSGSGKMDYAKQGLALLVDAMTEGDTFTLIQFDDSVQTLFGPAKIADKNALKAQIAQIQPAAGTNIYDGLKAGYEAALSVGDETQQRRVIFLTDGLATAGDTSSTDIAAMSLGYNDKYIGLTTIGLGADADVGLLRGLSEKGGGNFYFIEDPQAVTEVFTEELAFFVAPLAYDLDLSFEKPTGVGVAEVFGSNLYTTTPTGGTIHVPSVFLESRTTTDAGPSGGRRGGGSAIMVQLKQDGSAAPLPSPYLVGQLHLRYRRPGSSTFETQDATVSYGDNPWFPPTSGNGYYSDPSIEKNTLILDLFVALRDTTAKAQTDPTAAKAFLAAFQPTMQARLAGWTDADLADDMKIVQEYLDVLAKYAH